MRCLTWHCADAVHVLNTPCHRKESYWKTFSFLQPRYCSVPTLDIGTTKAAFINNAADQTCSEKDVICLLAGESVNPSHCSSTTSLFVYLFLWASSFLSPFFQQVMGSGFVWSFSLFLPFFLFVFPFLFSHSSLPFFFSLIVSVLN